MQSKNSLVSEEIPPERVAQVEIVLRIIEEAKINMNIAFHLWRTLDESDIWELKIRSDAELKAFMDQLSGYITTKTALPNIPAHINVPLLELMYYCRVNYALLQELPHWSIPLNKSDAAALKAIELLKNLSKNHLEKSGISELNKDKRIHQFHYENRVLCKNILENQEKLRSQRINLRWKLVAKKAIVKKLEDELSTRKWDNHMCIKKEIVRSNKLINKIHTESLSRQDFLEKELQDISIIYDTLRRENLQLEKEDRDEKNKLLFQLQTIVKKFDINIGAKICEHMELKEHYDKQKAIFDDFMVEFMREEEEYENIVKQKEEEERQEQQEKLMLFMMNRAARILQKFWRRYRRDQKKRKGKRGKGRKK